MYTIYNMVKLCIPKLTRGRVNKGVLELRHVKGWSYDIS